MAIVLLSFAPLALWHQEMPSSPPDAPANPEINEAQVSNLQGKLDGIMAKLDSLEKIAKDGSDLEKVMSMLEKFKDVGAEKMSSQATATLAWNTLPQNKQGRGVVYAAYSFDTNISLPKFFEEAVVSAEQLKKNNPTIPIAIITNAKVSMVPSVFDHIIRVRDEMLFTTMSTRSDGVFRQWFTRAFYLAHSPFEITWYTDSSASFLTTTLVSR